MLHQQKENERRYLPIHFSYWLTHQPLVLDSIRQTSFEEVTYGKSVEAIFLHVILSKFQGFAFILNIAHMHILKDILEARGIPQPRHNH